MAGDWVRSAVSPGVQAAQPGCGKLVELQGSRMGLLSTPFSSSHQPDTSRQRWLLCFEVWFRPPLSEVLRMHTAMQPDP